MTIPQEPFVTIKFPSGRILKLQGAALLSAQDFLGLAGQGPDRAVGEVSYHPADNRILGLKNTSDHAWRVTIPGNQSRVIEPGKTFRLAAGTQVQFGSASGIIEERPFGYVLRSGAGFEVPLSAGQKLTAEKLFGLQPRETAAQVVRNPTEPMIIGLRNLTSTPWRALMPDGSQRLIEHSKSVRLAPGTKIDLGFLQAEIDGPGSMATGSGTPAVRLPSLPHKRRAPVAAVFAIVLLLAGWLGWHLLPSHQGTTPDTSSLTSPSTETGHGRATMGNVDGWTPPDAMVSLANNQAIAGNADAAKQYFDGRLPELLNIYKQGLVNDPFLRGVLTVRLHVNATGQVTLAAIKNSAMTMDTINRQVLTAMDGWQILGVGADTEITYPILFARDSWEKNKLNKAYARSPD